MARRFRMVDYERSLDQTIAIRDVLPPDHLARFIVQVIAMLDVSAIYAAYAPVGGEAYAPELLLGLLFYGYATGVFSSRKIEKATYESIPFRFLAGGWHPDHDTIANFRKTFLPEITSLFAQVLVIAHELGVLKLGKISVDGSKVHADASKSHAVSYGRLLKLEQRLSIEVEELMALGEDGRSGRLAGGNGHRIRDCFARGTLAQPGAGQSSLGSTSRGTVRGGKSRARGQVAGAGRES